MKSAEKSKKNIKKKEDWKGGGEKQEGNNIGREKKKLRLRVEKMHVFS